MALDIVNLRHFYTEALGLTVRRILQSRMQEIWPSVAGHTVCGLGYAIPYLQAMHTQAQRTIACMPAHMGVTRWPDNGPNMATLVDEYALPLLSESVHRVVLIHLLEDVANPHDVMREVWRVLVPGGRVLIVVPNRRGAWAPRDNTPFGQGRPYSKRQMLDLLRETSFSLNTWRESLFFPAYSHKLVLRSADTLENIGRFVPIPFAGVYIAEAVKQIYAPIAVKRPAFAPIPQWQPSTPVVG